MKIMKKHGQFLILSGLILTIVFAARPTMAEQPTPGQLAGEILETCNVKGGLVVHIGCGDGRLTAALGANDSYVVHGLDRDAAKVEQARRYIQGLDLYGKVSVVTRHGADLPYADNMVNLLLAEDLRQVPMKECLRVLAPNGVAYIKSGGRWNKTVKPWPDAIDEWTHWMHDASGNAVARDRVVGPPRHLQWVAKPLWQRHHDTVPSTTAMVSAGGRLFYISDEAPACLDGSVPDKWFLVARDAFNGLLLWKHPIRRWGWNQWSTEWKGRFSEPPHLPKRLVAAGDRVYVTLNYNAPLTSLDAATGKVVRVYEDTQGTDEILYRDGLLVLSVNHEARKPDADNKTPVKKSVCVLEADTGKMLWKKGSYSGLRGKFNSTEPFGRLELTLGGDQVFLADHDAIVGLDLKSGEKRWRIPRPQIAEHLIMYGIRMSDMSVMLYQDGVLLFAQPEMKKKRSWHSLPGTLYAYQAETGDLLWKHTYGGWSHNWQPDVFVVDSVVWVFEHLEVEMRSHEIIDKTNVEYAVIALDLKTGRLKRRISAKEAFDVGHHHRCHRNKATERFILASRRGVEFLDLASGENRLHHWARGACLHGIVPCNGLLYLTPHPCDCYIATKLNGYIALAPQGDPANRIKTAQADDNSFEPGPAYRSTKIPSPASNDWPAFRHDSLRSGSTQTQVPADLDISWRADLGGRLSPPVVAGPKAFVTSIDRHRLSAFDAISGEAAWDFTAGGRIDTPPTIHKGLALFGSADGWVYCLRAADGRVAWRRRVAPQERLVGAFGQLESAWPVHGSILVKDDVAYLAAGRSSYLDNGIYLYALDPATGKILEKDVFYSPDQATGKMPPGDAKKLPGVLADILVSDGSSIFMRQEKVFDNSSRDKQHILATGGLRDDSWFNRTRWAVGAMTNAQLLVFDKKMAYGVQAYPGTARWGFFNPATKGYLLFAGELEKQRTDKHSAGGAAKVGRDGKLKRLWQKRVPVRITAMVLAKDTLFAAGTPDVIAPEDPLGALEGRLGGILCAFGASDGKKLAEYKLKSPPVLDGLIAANGRLYLAAKDGTLVCMTEK
ncbi:MAG: PQQ-binding-like beta-propeller repeat protein [Phycisphaerae bacterium]|nr:PQQ-binding-like beta-propeller repeat protein [Phycisphaerae bacterium]